MLNGGFEILNVAAGDFVKRKLARGYRGQSETAGATSTLSQFVTGSRAVMAPDVEALEGKESGFPGSSSRERLQERC